jgi:Flp pilus assembly protein TadG
MRTVGRPSLRRPWVQRRQGSSTVEAAVTLPLIALTLVLLVQGALYLHARNVVTAAAREGAHAAAMEHTSAESAVGDGQSRAAAIVAAGLGSYGRNIVVLTALEDGGNVVVDIIGTFPLLTFGQGGEAHLSLPLTARARAQREFFRPRGDDGY